MNAKKNQMLVLKSDLPMMAIAVMAGVVLMLLSTLSARGQKVNEIELVSTSSSAQEHARAYQASGDTEFLFGGYRFERVMPDGTRSEEHGEFALNRGLAVTVLQIQFQPLIDDTDVPLPGLPSNEVGSCVAYSLWLQGENAFRQSTGYGYFYANALSPGDPIQVHWSASATEQEIDFDLPAGVNPEDLILQLNDSRYGGWSYYDQTLGGFRVWIGLISDLTYRITDLATGRVWLGTLEDEAEDEKFSAISFVYDGGVRSVDLRDKPWAALARQRFNLVDDESNQPAAVYMTNLYDSSAQIYVYGLIGSSRIEVRAWAEVGQEMPLIAIAEGSGEPDPWGWTRPTELSIPAGYGPVNITIIGETGPDGFQLDLWLSSPGSGGGIGKG